MQTNKTALKHIIMHTYLYIFMNFVSYISRSVVYGPEIAVKSNYT